MHILKNPLQLHYYLDLATSLHNKHIIRVFQKYNERDIHTAKTGKKITGGENTDRQVIYSMNRIA